MAFNPTAIFYSSRMIQGLKNRAAELVRVSAGRVDDRPCGLAGRIGRLALTSAWSLTSFNSIESLSVSQVLIVITADKMVAASSGGSSRGLHHLATSLPEHYFQSIWSSSFMPMEEDTVERDTRETSRLVIYFYKAQTTGCSSWAISNQLAQTPNATSFSSNTDLQGRPSQPFHPIGSLEAH